MTWEIGRTELRHRMESLIIEPDYPQLTHRYIVIPDKELGRGGFGTVYYGIRKIDRLPVAVKLIKKTPRLGRLGKKVVPLEIELLAKTQHIKGVVRLLDYGYDTTNQQWIIVMEKLDDYLDLFDYVNGYRGGLCESDAKVIMHQVIDIVTAVHKAGVVHRDIKDENILINRSTKAVVLIDYGAADVMRDTYYTEFDGTTLYSPPEWLNNGKYKGRAAEVWALGTLAFVLVNRKAPFQTKQQICEGGDVVWERRSRGVSRLMHDFVTSCLRKDTTQRQSMDQLRRHPWLHSTDAVLSDSSAHTSTDSLLSTSINTSSINTSSHSECSDETDLAAGNQDGGGTVATPIAAAPPANKKARVDSGIGFHLQHANSAS